MNLLFALQTPALADTVVTVPARDIVDLLFALAAGGIAATFFAILLLLLVVLVQTRRGIKAVEQARAKFAADPGIQSLRRIAENAEAMSQTAREEFENVREGVTRLTDRLDQASELLESRIDDFNALLEVVQGEAEGAFIDGAATARGLRAGIGSLGDSSSGTNRNARRRKKQGERGVREGIPAGEEDES
jgi:hypothetical protein